MNDHAGHKHRTDWLTDKELSELKTEHTGCEIWVSGCVWCLLIEEVRQRRKEASYE
jgi:hypothetical protein